MGSPIESGVGTVQEAQQLTIMKILVFCSDLLPLPGLPTSGGGLRCWQMIQSLKAAGHEVVASMPLFTFHGRRWREHAPAEYVETSWSPGDQDRLVAEHRPDAILFTSTWIVDQLQKPFAGLRIYDLDGPQLLEMHYKTDLDPVASPHAKIQKLAQADFVFCAGQRQRFYFWPFLMLAGLPIESLSQIPVIPVALMDPPPAHSHPERVEVIVAGGFYPWQDPRIGLEVLGRVAGDYAPQKLRVRVIGSSHGVTGEDDRRYNAIRSQLERLPNVEFLDFVAHEQLTQLCQNASFAFELHARNPERELAVTTRTVDALWSGLPVLYNDFGELSDLIRSYDAGWVVDPEDAGAVESALRSILDGGGDLQAKSRNAQRLASDKFVGVKPAEPLIQFLENPARRAPEQPAAILSGSDARKLKRAESELQRVHQSRSYQMARRVASIRQVWRSNRRGD